MEFSDEQLVAIDKVMDFTLPITSDIINSGVYLFQIVVQHDNGIVKNGLKRFSFTWNKKPPK